MTWPVDPSVIPAFLAAMVLVELTPGPNMGYLAALSADRGRVAGFAAVLGVTLGLGVYLLASVAGLTELLQVWPLAYEALRWAGVAFLLWLAWDAWSGAESAPARIREAGSLASLVGRGFLANVLNPKAALFYVTLMPGFVSAGFGPQSLQIATLGLIHLAISVVLHSLIVLGAARAGQIAASFAPGARFTIVRKALAVGIALVAVWLAWQTRRS